MTPVDIIVLSVVLAVVVVGMLVVIWLLRSRQQEPEVVRYPSAIPFTWLDKNYSIRVSTELKTGRELMYLINIHLNLYSPAEDLLVFKVEKNVYSLLRTTSDLEAFFHTPDTGDTPDHTVIETLPKINPWIRNIKHPLYVCRRAMTIAELFPYQADHMEFDPPLVPGYMDPNLFGRSIVPKAESGRSIVPLGPHSAVVPPPPPPRPPPYPESRRAGLRGA
eukprot:Sspe_Gene.101976::Locus_76664_Transcript_1_1_Confidence_1.000_Length_708::g.101976::m.101976